MHPEIFSIALFWFVTAYTPGPNNVVASYSGFNFGITKTIPHILGVTLGFTSLVLFLSIGLIIGTNMFGNVFTVIIPNQMNIINSSKNNKKFDMSLSLAAKQRSIHNNYSTFLVLFIMLSGHYSFIVYHKYNWLILCLVAVISAIARHYFNLRGKNIHRLNILIFSILAFISLAVLLFIFKN